MNHSPMSSLTLLEKVRVTDFEPETAAKDVTERKARVRDALLQALQAKSVNLDEIRRRCREAEFIQVDVTFYLYRGSTEIGRLKKDLDNMLKILCDALPQHMISQDTGDRFPGVGLIDGDSDEKIFKIICRKMFVINETERGFELEISQYNRSQVEAPPVAPQAQ